MRSLVLGAGGFIGLNLIDALTAQGLVVRAGRRERTNVLPLRARKVPLVLADLERPDTLDAAMDGMDAVYFCAGYYPRDSLDRTGALDKGLVGLQNALDAAARQSVSRFVYVSSTATVAPTAGGASCEAHVYGETPGHGVYHDLKWLMERRALNESRFDVVVACPSGCVGPWDLRVGTSALLVASAHGRVPPHPDGIVSLIDARDVGRALVALGLHPQPERRVLLSAMSLGLQSLLNELCQRYAKPPAPPAISAAEAVAFADREELRARAEGGRASISREIVDLVIHGVPIDGSFAERHLGLRYRPLSDTLDAFDSWARRMRIIPPAATVQNTSDRTELPHDETVL